MTSTGPRRAATWRPNQLRHRSIGSRSVVIGHEFSPAEIEGLVIFQKAFRARFHRDDRSEMRTPATGSFT